jgi:hypothetical protein
MHAVAVQRPRGSGRDARASRRRTARETRAERYFVSARTAHDDERDVDDVVVRRPRGVVPSAFSPRARANASSRRVLVARATRTPVASRVLSARAFAGSDRAR